MAGAIAAASVAVVAGGVLLVGGDEPVVRTPATAPGPSPAPTPTDAAPSATVEREPPDATAPTDRHRPRSPARHGGADVAPTVAPTVPEAAPPVPPAPPASTDIGPRTYSGIGGSITVAVTDGRLGLVGDPSPAGRLRHARSRTTGLTGSGCASTTASGARRSGSTSRTGRWSHESTRADPTRRGPRRVLSMRNERGIIAGVIIGAVALTGAGLAIAGGGDEPTGRPLVPLPAAAPSTSAPDFITVPPTVSSTSIPTTVAATAPTVSVTVPEVTAPEVSAAASSVPAVTAPSVTIGTEPSSSGPERPRPTSPHPRSAHRPHRRSRWRPRARRRRRRRPLRPGSRRRRRGSGNSGPGSDDSGHGGGSGRGGDDD